MVQRVWGFIQFLQPLYCFFSAEKFSGNTVAFVTAHSRIPYWRKYFRQPPYFHHIPKTLQFHRQTFVVCLWRVLKIPKQSIFFQHSIPLYLQPLLQFRHIRKIYASWPFRKAPFFCEVFTPFCHRFPKFLQSIAAFPFVDLMGRFIPGVYTLPLPRTAVCRCNRICLLIISSVAPSYHCLFPRFPPLWMQLSQAIIPITRSFGISFLESSG